jgi:hypothetical protein
MQIGYNNDIQYREQTFHIQTEDRGEPAASIETQIFHSGAILDTSIISYQKVLDEVEDVDERIAKIRALMKGNHKKLYKKLFAGEYDEMVGLEPLDKPEKVEPTEFEPSQDLVPAAALELEQGGGNIEELLGDQPEGEAVGLAELQAQLNRDAAKAEAAAEPPSEAQDDAAPTIMLTPDEVGDTIQTRSIPKPRSKRVAAPVTKPRDNVIDFPTTGASAWRGCEEPTGDLNIVSLVEEFVGG